MKVCASTVIQWGVFFVSLQVGSVVSGQSSAPVELSGHADAVYGIAFSPDGRWMASGSYDRTVILWDLNDRSVAATLQGHTDQVFRVKFSPDGTSLASCSGDGTVILWDVETRSTQSVLAGHGDPIIDVAYSADGKRVVTAGSHIQLWQSGDLIWSTPHSHLFFSVAVSYDQASLACGTQDRIRFHDIAGGEPVGDLSGAKGMIYQLDFSPDGKWLASACSDGELSIWDAASRKKSQAVSADNSALFAAAFSPDGTRVITGGRERVIRVWNVPQLQLVAQFEGPVETVLSVSFSPDGRSIASGSYDGRIHLWSLTD